MKMFSALKTECNGLSWNTPVHQRISPGKGISSSKHVPSSTFGDSTQSCVWWGGIFLECPQCALHYVISVFIMTAILWDHLILSFFQKSDLLWGAVSHTCNSNTLEGWGSWIMRSGVRDQPGQHGETLSLLKIQKLTGHGGKRLWSQLLGRLRQENCLNPGGGGCNKPRLHHWIPAWATEQDSKNNNNK